MCGVSQNQESMSKQSDLFDISLGNLPKAKPSEAPLAPVVEAVLHDADGVYAKDVMKAGIVTHPQIVSVIAAEGHQCYLARLLEADPSVGGAVLYGTFVMRGSQYVADALEVASETLLHSPELRPLDARLIVHVVNAAFATRGLDESAGENIRRGLERFNEVEEICSRNGRLAVEGDVEIAFPEFSRHRIFMDELQRIAGTRGSVEGSFFGSLEPSLGNYLKATFGMLSTDSASLREKALEYFSKLDEPLVDLLRFGLAHGYLTK